MAINIKSIIFRLSLIFCVIIPISEIDAQTQEFYDAYNVASSNYDNYYYSYVPQNLQPCINEIWYEPNRPYYRTDGRTWVFNVYKLLISSNQQAGYYEVAESKKQELINYFYGYLTYDDVIYYLNN